LANGEDIEDRLINYAVRIIRVCKAMPVTIEDRHISGQLLRSGTSAAPNYGEARSAESNRDSVHKLKIVLKELNESRIWLKIIIRGDLLSTEQLDPLVDETDQLCRIISSSIQTSRINN